MACFNLYIFNRAGACVHYHEWHRPKSVREGAGTPADDQKQMFGLFWTLGNFTAALDPKKCVGLRPQRMRVHQNGVEAVASARRPASTISS